MTAFGAAVLARRLAVAGTFTRCAVLLSQLGSVAISATFTVLSGQVTTLGWMFREDTYYDSNTPAVRSDVMLDRRARLHCGARCPAFETPGVGRRVHQAPSAQRASSESVNKSVVMRDACVLRTCNRGCDACRTAQRTR